MAKYDSTAIKDEKGGFQKPYQNLTFVQNQT